MKIAMFTDTYFPQVSGVSTSIKLLKEELEKNGHEVTIFTTTDPDSNKEEKNIVRILSIPFIFFTDRRMVVGGMYRALRIAKKEKFDIVHTHTEFGLGFIGRFIASKMQIPHVHTYHTLYHRFLHYIAKGKLLKEEHVKFMLKAFCANCNGLIAPSKLTEETLLGYDIEKQIRIIPTGVKIPSIKDENTEDNIEEERISRLKEELGITKDEIVLLSLSRLSKEKSLDKLIDSLPEVLKVYPDTKLVFVGDGPAREELEKQTKKLKLEEKIVFVGEVENTKVNSYYKMANIYVNASTSETQGLTYLESLVNKTPVIAARNEYLSGIITAKDLGMLFDEETPLPDAIIKYIKLIKEDNVKFDINRIETLLYNISDVKFGKEVISYYEELIKENNSKKKEEKKSFQKSNKILREITIKYSEFVDSFEEVFRGFINKNNKEQ